MKDQLGKIFIKLLVLLVVLALVPIHYLLRVNF